MKRTSSVETYLHGLLKFTNYSVRLLAYTSVGDGVVSDTVYCATEQDGKFAWKTGSSSADKDFLLLHNSEFHYFFKKHIIKS